MKRVALLAAVAVVLGGCQTKPVAEMSYSELMATSRDIQKRCEEQGAFHPSPAFELCIRQEISREHATRASNAARLDRGSALAGASLMNASQGFYRAAAQPTYSSPVTCTSTRTPSGSVTTRC